MKLYVGNLAYSMSDLELTELFSQYGDVVSAKIVTDHFSGQPKGFAFVEMATRGEGHKAMENLNGSSLNNRPLAVNEAKAKPKKRGGRR